MAGAIGGMLFSTLAGHILQWTGSYLTLFVISGSAYLVAFGIIQILVPKLDPVRL
jgi:ACS family hexuronate transporter-like MFS transporter